MVVFASNTYKKIKLCMRCVSQNEGELDTEDCVYEVSFILTHLTTVTNVSVTLN